MSIFPIVGRKFSPTEFADYVANVSLTNWSPSMVVLHNTASPNLADRPNGLTQKHIEILHHYYEFEAPKKNGAGWSGGPHLFVDQTGIWVFNPLDRPGVHSPSFNGKAWGVEMLGDYAKEPFDTGDGKKVQDNAVSALVSMFRRLGHASVTNADLRLHKEDPATDHDCPGKNVKKPAVLAAVNKGLVTAPMPGGGIPVEILVWRRGKGQSPVADFIGEQRDGTTFADAARLSGATGIKSTAKGDVGVRAFVGSKFAVAWEASTNRIFLHEN